jgi:hypothetical protein
MSAAMAIKGTSRASRFLRLPPVGPRTRSVIPSSHQLRGKRRLPSSGSTPTPPSGAAAGPTACVRRSLRRG